VIKNLDKDMEEVDEPGDGGDIMQEDRKDNELE